jgi:hypothetical protein
MEKEVRQFEIDYQLDWTGCFEISQLRNDLDIIEKLGATHVNISARGDGDYSYMEVLAINEREETNEEFALRLEIKQKKEAEIQRRELAELQRIRLKYGIE